MTANEAKAAVAVLKAVVETIREAGPQGAAKIAPMLEVQAEILKAVLWRAARSHR